MKPVPKDGHHYRWYYHPFAGWEVVCVGPWNNKTCTFDRCGFSESTQHWVKHTDAWQWGPKIEPPPSPKVPKKYDDGDECVKLLKRVHDGD